MEHMDTGQGAEALGVTRRRVQAIIKSGRLPGRSLAGTGLTPAHLRVLRVGRGRRNPVVIFLIFGGAGDGVGLGKIKGVRFT